MSDIQKKFDHEINFNNGMGAKLEGNYLIWNHEDAWIRVDDLPTKLINEIKDHPYYSAVYICEAYLHDTDSPTNDGWL